jgi:hypothetical protein
VRNGFASLLRQQCTKERPRKPRRTIILLTIVLKRIKEEGAYNGYPFHIYRKKYACDFKNGQNFMHVHFSYSMCTFHIACALLTNLVSTTLGCLGKNQFF